MQGSAKVRFILAAAFAVLFVAMAFSHSAMAEDTIKIGLMPL